MYRFSEDVPQIINPSEPHLACLFLVDTSGAMAGEIINETSKTLNAFMDEVKKNKSLCEILDVAVVQYNSSASIMQEFVPVEYMEPVCFFAQGSSDLHGGLRLSIDMILERCRWYRRLGTQNYVPSLILITDDGCPNTSIADITSEVKELASKNKLRLWLMGTKGSQLENILDLGLSKRVFLLDDGLARLLDKMLSIICAMPIINVDNDERI